MSPDERMRGVAAPGGSAEAESQMPEGRKAGDAAHAGGMGERGAARLPRDGEAMRGWRTLGQFLAATLLFLTPLLLLPLARAAQADAWQPLGLRGQTVLALAVTSRGDQRVIYAETSTGLWRLDQAHTNGALAGSEGAQSGGWQQIDAGLPRTALGGPALAAWRNVPGRPQQLYALTESGTARQLYRSDDGGASWQRIGPAPGQTEHPAMLILPGPAGFDLITVATGSRAQRSADGGATWAPGGPWPGGDADVPRAERGVERVAALLGEPSAPDRLYALASDGGLWMSESAGLSWRAVNPSASEAAAATGGAAVSALAIAPYFGIRIWAATADGLALSADNGATWTLLPLSVAPDGHGRIVALRNDPRVPETIYAALNGGVVYRSDDSGVTWSSLGEPGARHVAALTVDPDSRSVLYAATEDGIWVRAVAPPQPTLIPTPTPTLPQPTETATHTPSPTASRTPTPTRTSTATPPLTSTPTPSPSVTPSPTLTATATRRPTATRTATPLVVPSVGPAWTATDAPGSQPPQPVPSQTPPAPPPTQPAPSETPPEPIVTVEPTPVPPR